MASSPPVPSPPVPAHSLVVRARVAGRSSQQIYAALLWALAEPGTLRRLPAEVLDPDIPVVAWPALALADVDVSVSIDDAVDHPLARLVADATGAAVTRLPEAWLAALTAATPDQLDRVAIGTALEPERAAKLALPVTSLGGSDGEGALGLRLEGPGVPGCRLLWVNGLDRQVAARLGRASGPFPAGFDTWLMAPDGTVAGLPRSTTIELIDVPESGPAGPGLAESGSAGPGLAESGLPESGLPHSGGVRCEMGGD